MNKPLGIYIHVPFCKQKCVYCDFYSLPRREDQMDAYVSALRAQLAEADFSGYEADTVYFGGGTPSYLGPRRLTALLEAASAACSIAPGAEITLEANPDSAGDPDALSALRQAGFNRVSLGMQSADDGELRAIGRVHTMAQVRASADAVRRAGFDNLSLDLIYGLPGQSLPRWRENLSAAAALCPEHLSCYGLKAEPGTPLYARRDTLPGDGAQADMYLETVDFLESRGYRQYEISNFAKPGRESRHNLKYWTQEEYLDPGGVRRLRPRGPLRLPGPPVRLGPGPGGVPPGQAAPVGGPGHEPPGPGGGMADAVPPPRPGPGHGGVGGTLPPPLRPLPALFESL